MTMAPFRRHLFRPNILTQVPLRDRPLSPWQPSSLSPTEPLSLLVALVLPDTSPGACGLTPTGTHRTSSPPLADSSPLCSSSFWPLISWPVPNFRNTDHIFKYLLSTYNHQWSSFSSEIRSFRLPAATADWPRDLFSPPTQGKQSVATATTPNTWGPRFSGIFLFLLLKYPSSCPSLNFSTKNYSLVVFMNLEQYAVWTKIFILAR